MYEDLYEDSPAKLDIGAQSYICKLLKREKRGRNSWKGMNLAATLHQDKGKWIAQNFIKVVAR